MDSRLLHFPDIPNPSVIRHSHRKRRISVRLLNYLPHGDGRLLVPDDLEAQAISSTEASENLSFQQDMQPGNIRVVLNRWRTNKNVFGLFKEYVAKPLSLNNVGRAAIADVTEQLQPLGLPLGPLKNYSELAFARVFFTNTPGSVSFQFANRITHGLFNDPLVRPSELANLDAQKLHERISTWDLPLTTFLALEGASTFSPSGLDLRWHQSALSIDVPLGRKGQQRHISFLGGNLVQRSLVDTISHKIRHDRFYSPTALIPYRHYLSQGDSKERIYDHPLSCDAMIDEYQRIQTIPRETGDDLERCIVGIQLWSDSTKLANFGNHKLWPVYACLTHTPTWARDKAGNDVWFDVGYIPTFPESFNTFMIDACGSPASPALITHCRREFFNAAMLKIFDNTFAKACTEGIVMQFPDGGLRRCFIRVTSYSGDYPEKVQLAGIRFLGSMPCSHCLIPKSEISMLGTEDDTIKRDTLSRSKVAEESSKLVWKARKLIYSQGLSLNSKRVKSLLQPRSLVPMEAALSMRLVGSGQYITDILAVDILHDFELGVWKSVLTHLIRLLYTFGPNKVEEMNQRYRLVPPFGEATVRHVNYDVSSLSQLAGRDFVQLLQCALPVFDGLFIEMETLQESVNNLLYSLVDWYSIAKMALQTESTLCDLAKATTQLGDDLRAFQEVTSSIQARETPGERQKRIRTRHATASRQKEPRIAAPGNDGLQIRGFKLDTSKIHEIGHYVDQLRRIGPADIISTQAGEKRHKLKKVAYQHTTKNCFEIQLATKASVEEKVTAIDEMVSEALGVKSKVTTSIDQSYQLVKEAESIQRSNHPEVNQSHVTISSSAYCFVELNSFLTLNQSDPAMEVGIQPPLLLKILPAEDHLTVQGFQERLVDHLFARLQNVPYAFDGPLFTDEDYSTLRIEKDRLHFHGKMLLSYTSYSGIRKRETIKPFLKISHHNMVVSPGNSPRCVVMIASCEDERATGEHPFWYAKVLAIFHCMASNSSYAKAKRVDILWVRWFGRVPNRGDEGSRLQHLDKVGFVESGDDDETAAFGFVDPKDVIRASHLIPAFQDGRTQLTLTQGRRSFVHENATFGDWSFCYVGQFVDRDMAMRYRGGGLYGHRLNPAQHHNGVPEGHQHLTPVSSLSSGGVSTIGGDSSMCRETARTQTHSASSSHQAEDAPAPNLSTDTQCQLLSGTDSDSGDETGSFPASEVADDASSSNSEYHWESDRCSQSSIDCELDDGIEGQDEDSASEMSDI